MTKNNPTNGGTSGAGTSGAASVAKAGTIRDEPLKPLPKRFYKMVTAVPQSDGMFALALDGRIAKTPLKKPLTVPGEALASVLVAEWAAQQTHINPSVMPLTTLATTAIDAVAGQEAAVAAEIARYAMSDLLCYRAETPRDLASAQAEAWDPPLAWAGMVLGSGFKTTLGIMPVAQNPEIERAVSTRLRSLKPLELAAMHVLTTVMGSAVLALAVRENHLTFAAAWRAAHVDEDHQIALWGGDDEAEARRRRRHRDCEIAAMAVV